MKFIIGRKLNMTQVFRPDGSVVPVTRIQAGPLTVTQIKNEGGKQISVQVGFDATVKHMNAPLRGHLKGLPHFRVLKEFQTAQPASRGDLITVETFTVGDVVDAIGTSKGKGFAGVVKRHHFRGGPASHGHKDNLRAPGSIGAGGVQRVFKGMRMAGHMGDERVTVKNLEIVAIDTEKNELFVKGAVPGARNSVVVLQTNNDEFSVKVASTEAQDETPILEESAQPGDATDTLGGPVSSGTSTEVTGA